MTSKGNGKNVFRKFFGMRNVTRALTITMAVSPVVAVGPALVNAAGLTDLAATPGNGEVTLTYTAPTGATSIAVEQSTDGTTWTTADVLGIELLDETSTSAIVVNLDNSQQYQFRLIVTGGTYAGTSNIVTATPLYKYIIDRYIENANIAKADVVISVDGTDVTGGAQWVTQEAYDALNAAIQGAINAKSTITTDDEVMPVVEAIERAIGAFMQASFHASAPDVTLTQGTVPGTIRLNNVGIDTMEMKINNGNYTAIMGVEFPAKVGDVIRIRTKATEFNAVSEAKVLTVAAEDITQYNYIINNLSKTLTGLSLTVSAEIQESAVLTNQATIVYQLVEVDRSNTPKPVQLVAVQNDIVNNQVVSAKFNLPEVGKNYIVEAYVWDNLNDMNPLANPAVTAQVTAAP